MSWDIIVFPPFRFHKLKGDLKQFFAIDVKTSRDKWRVILRPLDENEQIYEIGIYPFTAINSQAA